MNRSLALNRIILSILMTYFLVPSVIIAQRNVPSTPRSREAISRVEPKLRQEFEASGLVYGSPIYLRIFKEDRELEVWAQQNGKSFTLFKTYEICTYGQGTLGPKIRQGDGQAPEGFYFVRARQLNPWSRFHLSFNLGYPNRYDRSHGRTGSALMVHGSCVSIGCYAMTDERIEEIYTLADVALRNGQSFFRVHIFPFRMTNENMKKHIKSQWYTFWQNLQTGYDKFYEYGNNPPNVEVQNRRYIFNRTK